MATAAEDGGHQAETPARPMNRDEYLDSLRDGREIWIYGEKVEDVTTHPAFRNGARSIARLYDAMHDPATRSIRPELLVVVGICTHLGCSPGDKFTAGAQPSLPADWPGGWLCPCHGSTFDLAGRVFKNKPAPDNLRVPPYIFASGSDHKLIIGEDENTKA